MRRRDALWAAAILSLLVQGCAGEQSALDASGEDAARIISIALVLLFGATVIFVLVLLTLFLALRGGSGLRNWLANESTVRIGGMALPIVALTLLLTYGLWSMRYDLLTSPPIDARIEVTGERWWWRVSYSGADGRRIAEANEIRIPVGRTVEMSLKSADVIHSFWVPSLGGKLDMIPGRTNVLRIKAERPGVYRGQCAEFCGGSHALMAIEVIAVPAPEFAAWIASRAPAEPTGDLERRGAALFFSAGCGACHTIRGTQATGNIGPDLSRIGARRSIAAASLPGGRDGIARFIKDGQAVKPGNAMPPFKIFAPGDLDAVAAFLAGLQ